MRAISSLITEYSSAERTALTDETVLNMARWLTKIVRIFGLDGSADPNDTTTGRSGIEIPKVSEPFVFQVSKERDEVRQHAISGSLSDETLAAITSKDVSTTKRSRGAICRSSLKVLGGNQGSSREESSRKRFSRTLRSTPRCAFVGPGYLS